MASKAASPDRQLMKLRPLRMAAATGLLFLLQPFLILLQPLPVSAVMFAQNVTDLDSVRQSMRAGNYADVISAVEAIETYPFSEQLVLLKARAEFATGNYADAKATIDAGIEEKRNSAALRWFGATVYEYNNDIKTSLELRNKVGALWQQSEWQYRDYDNLLVIGRYQLQSGVDPKIVLQKFFAKARDSSPGRPEAYQAIGDLALEKNDYALAAENFRKAIELDDSNPDTWFGIAAAFKPNPGDEAAAALEKSLELNPAHVPSLLMLIERQVAAENYESAEVNIAKILDVNPHRPEAWAYRAVLAHLNNDPAEEGGCRAKALAHWKGNAEVDYLIGLQLSKKYRFEEASAYQRRALAYDPGFAPAKIQLAHDLLRLGQELEGWKLAEEIFDADQYNVVANNLVALRDNISQFATLEQNGFVIRMDRNEAAVYGNMVLQLVEEAEQKLATKYRIKLQKPVFIEIFPRQQDFAIRTFGLPGGAGFLGVCFGRVVTMNSPVAQGATPTNWRSVLWHEFCHVVTLQKTQNKMPRWLSEGISVYEETLADRAWGDSINPRYREMILGDDLTDVSKLSGAFLRPESPMHLQFAYYESSLVVRFLIEQYGEDALVSLLEDLSTGTPINDALRRHAAPTDVLDKAFAEYATGIATSLAVDADWTKPEDGFVGSAAWTKWLDENPDNIYGLFGLAEAQVEEKDFEPALETIERLVGIYPETSGAENAFKLKAVAHRGLDQPGKEKAALEKAWELDASDVSICVRLLEIYTADENWDNVKRVSRRLQGINPMLKSAHRRVAIAGEKTGDDELTIESLSALVALGPFDRADVHYRLGSAQFRLQQYESAKRNVLLALDAAPRYRDAHKLLLKIVAAGKESAAETGDAGDAQATSEMDGVNK